MKWLLEFIADLRAEFAASRNEGLLDSKREEECLLKAHIQKLRRQHMALGDEIKWLEAEILKGVRL